MLLYSHFMMKKVGHQEIKKLAQTAIQHVVVGTPVRYRGNLLAGGSERPGRGAD